MQLDRGRPLEMMDRHYRINQIDRASEPDRMGGALGTTQQQGLFAGAGNPSTGLPLPTFLVPPPAPAAPVFASQPAGMGLAPTAAEMGGAGGFFSGLTPQQIAQMGALGLDVAAFMQAFGGGGGGATGLQNNPVNQLGMQQIMQILASGGRVPPEQLNRDITASERGGQASVQAIDAEMARRGLQGSGLGQALRAATQSRTADRTAEIRAADTAAAQQRQRDDLMRLFLPLLNIQLDEQALISGQYNADRARSDQRDASELAAIASLSDSILEAYGGD
jgi:hypothetical protein